MQCLNIFSISVDITSREDIRCGIAANDISLKDIDPMNDLNNLELELNGDLFTFDKLTNVKGINSKGNLLWNWGCYDQDNVSCDDLIDTSSSNRIIYIDFPSIFKSRTFDYASFYSFTFTMFVSHTLTNYVCMDSITFAFTTIAKSNTTTDLETEKLFMISVIPIDDEININERLRLIGNIINYDQSQLSNQAVMKYQWIELNGLLSNDTINKYKKSTDNSPNLILAENTLNSGEIYSFQLIVSQYSNSRPDRIGYGISTPINITTLSIPNIITGSFTITPDCRNRYESISELLSMPHTLSLSAHSVNVYTTLLYRFGYIQIDDISYFHSSTTAESTLSNVYFPVGDSEIFATVIDAELAENTETIQCSVELDTYSECIVDFAGFLNKTQSVNVHEHPQDVNATEQFAVICQISQYYVQYLNYYEGADNECMERSLRSILDALEEHVVGDSLCWSDFVVLLSQTMRAWLGFVNDLHGKSNSKTAPVSLYEDVQTLYDIKTLLFSILDPCLFITNHVTSMEDLRVTQESIINKIPKIYYDDEDVTRHLSVIITNPNYHHLLYSLSSSMMEMFQYLSHHDSIDLYNLLSASLYISELIKISLSIPGEATFAKFDRFTLYSTRINNENVNVTLQNISVFVPKDVIEGDDNDNSGGSKFFESVDVLIVGLDSLTTDDVAAAPAIVPNDNCDNVEGKLSEKSVAITVLGNHTNTSHLSSNINFTFICDGNGCDDTHKCVWSNEQDDIWENEGCITIIKDTGNEILCSCSHLTTFATIHNIHSSECYNSYLQEWLSSEVWEYINSIIIVIFFFIFVVSIYEIYPFLNKTRRSFFSWETHKAVVALSLLGVTSFLYVILCIQAYFTKLYLNPTTIQFYSLTLLLPRLTFFMLFTMIFHTWFTLAHGFLNNFSSTQRIMQKVLITINVSIWILLALYYITIVATDSNEIFHIGAYFWGLLFVVLSIIITIYSYVVNKVLLQAAKISQNQAFAKEDRKTVRRLLIINTFITLYFIYQAVTAVYLSIDSDHQTMTYSLIYSGIDALCI